MSKKNIKINNTKIQNSVEINSSKKTKFLPYICIIIFGFILYTNTLSNDYALDDAIVLTKNTFTQQGIKGIPEIFKYDTFTGFWLTSEAGKTAHQIQEEKKLVAGGRYRPLSVATFAMEVSFFGNKMSENNEEYLGNPFVSHLINIILYILCSCLLFKILIELVPTKKNEIWYLGFSFIASLLFLAHPIHTEAIANVKGRDEIMTLLGSLGALWFSIKYCKTQNKFNLLFSGICLFLGLLSKENSITFLAVIPITLYYFVEKKSKNILISLVPLIISSIIFLFIRGNILGFSHSETIANEIMNNPFLNTTLAEKFATIFYTLGLYLKLLIFPHPLTYDYYPNQIEIVNFANPKAFIPLIIYLALGIYAIYGLIKKRNLITWSIWLFLIPLSVVSNIFFPVGTFMNERFVFISSIGFCIFLAWMFYKLISKIKKNNLKIACSFFTIFLILFLYSIKTISRNKAWENDYVLFTTDVKVSSNSAKSNCSAGGKILEAAKLIKDNKPEHDKMCLQSIKYLEKSVEIHPTYVDALNLLGNAYYEYDYNISKTLNCYAKVLSISPYNSVTYNNTIIVASTANGALNDNNTKSTPQEILTSCDKILSIIPNFGEIIYLKAVIYGKYLNDLNTSIRLFEQVENLQNFNKNSTYYKDIGVAYGIAKQYDKALFYLLKVIETDKEDFQTYFNIGITYNIIGDVVNANKYISIGNEIKTKQTAK
ncbi:MAG: tetratricopeptide repeat protein [Bacteroidales bacterium]|jgi:hypothetical protein|nr:tetratricopeptide repeat protein [Bacteroidales bacterium]